VRHESSFYEKRSFATVSGMKSQPYTKDRGCGSGYRPAGAQRVEIFGRRADRRAGLPGPDNCLSFRNGGNSPDVQARVIAAGEVQALAAARWRADFAACAVS
jgi:hypothetical protein